jgi:hypothetical protein
MGAGLRERLSRTDRDERELLLARDRQRVPLRRVVAAAPPHHAACRNVTWVICCTAFFASARLRRVGGGSPRCVLRGACFHLPSPRNAAHSVPRHAVRLVVRECAAGACRAAQRRKVSGERLAPTERQRRPPRWCGAAVRPLCAAADLLRFPGRMSPAHASSASTASAFTCAGAPLSAAALCHLGPCPLRPARCTFYLARCKLYVACCKLQAVTWTLHVARCTLHVERCTLRAERRASAGSALPCAPPRRGRLCATWPMQAARCMLNASLQARSMPRWMHAPCNFHV